MKPYRFSKFELCKKKSFFWGSCRNITIPSYCISGFLCKAFFKVCAGILVLGEIFTSESEGSVQTQGSLDTPLSWTRQDLCLGSSAPCYTVKTTLEAWKVLNLCSMGCRL